MIATLKQKVFLLLLLMNRLSSYWTGIMRFQVGNRQFKNGGIFIKCRNTSIASIAQKASNFSSSMVMIDAEPVKTVAKAFGFRVIANCAKAILKIEKCVVMSVRYSISSYQCSLLPFNPICNFVLGIHCLVVATFFLFVSLIIIPVPLSPLGQKSFFVSRTPLVEAFPISCIYLCFVGLVVFSAAFPHFGFFDRIVNSHDPVLLKRD